MSALVKLPSTSGTGTYLGIPTSGKGMFKATKDSMGLQSQAKVLDFQDSVLDTEIKLNQTVKLVPPVKLNSKRYTVLISFNPKLAELGTVNCPSIMAPGQDIFMTFKAGKNCDLKDLDYIFTYYMID